MYSTRSLTHLLQKTRATLCTHRHATYTIFPRPKTEQITKLQKIDPFREINFRNQYYYEDLDYYNSKYYSTYPLVTKYDPKCGRYLVATRKIVAGECVLQAEPYLYSIQYKDRQKFCENCMKEITSSYSCLGCENQVFYCSKKCQEEHRQLHELECAAYQKLGYMVSMEEEKFSEGTGYSLVFDPKTRDENLTTLRYGIKLLAKKYAEEHFKLNGKYKYEDLLRLYSPRKLIHSQEKRELLLELSQLVNFLVDEELRIPVEELVDIFCKIECNQFAIVGSETERMNGYGVFPSASLFNHSCTPNCQLVEIDRKMNFFTVRDVEENEELTFSYVRLKTTNKRRKSHLLDTFCFECECEDQEKKNCNEDFLKKYLCQFCGKSLMVPTSPGSKERQCMNGECNHTQIGLNDEQQ